MNVYIQDATEDGTYHVSSLFSGNGDVNLNIDTTESSWEDVTLTDVSAFTVTLDY